MNIIINYLQTIAREIELKNNQILSLMDNYNISAKEEHIEDLLEVLEIFKITISYIKIS